MAVWQRHKTGSAQKSSSLLHSIGLFHLLKVHSLKFIKGLQRKLWLVEENDMIRPIFCVTTVIVFCNFEIPTDDMAHEALLLLYEWCINRGVDAHKRRRDSKPINRHLLEKCLMTHN